MPIMYGVPLPGHPFESSGKQNEPAKEILDIQASEKLKGETPMAKELQEATRNRDEAVKLLNEAKSDDDKQQAQELVDFWNERIAELNPSPDELSPPELIPQEPPPKPKSVEIPDVIERIKKSSEQRQKKSRKKEPKKVKKITYLI